MKWDNKVYIPYDEEHVILQPAKGHTMMALRQLNFCRWLLIVVWKDQLWEVAKYVPV